MNKVEYLNYITLNEQSILKSLPEKCAGSAEFRKANLPTATAEREIFGLCWEKSVHKFKNQNKTTQS